MPLTARPTAPDRQVSASELFGEKREVVIIFNGREYRMRVTKAGGLNLTA